MHICFCADEQYFLLQEHIIYIIRCHDLMAYENKNELFFSSILPHVRIIHKSNHHLSKRTKIISIGKLSMPHQPASSLKWKMTQLNKTINSLRWWCAHFFQQRTLLYQKYGLKIRDLQTILEIRRRSFGEKVGSFILMS